MCFEVQSLASWQHIGRHIRYCKVGYSLNEAWQKTCDIWMSTSYAQCSSASIKSFVQFFAIFPRIYTTVYGHNCIHSQTTDTFFPPCNLWSLIPIHHGKWIQVLSKLLLLLNYDLYRYIHWFKDKWNNSRIMPKYWSFQDCWFWELH